MAHHYMETFGLTLELIPILVPSRFFHETLSYHCFCLRRPRRLNDNAWGSNTGCLRGLAANQPQSIVREGSEGYALL